MKNFHLIRVEFVASINKPDRIKLTSDRFIGHKKVWLNSNDYNGEPIYEIAEKWLSENDFEVLGRGQGKNCFYIVTNTFKPLLNDR